MDYEAWAEWYDTVYSSAPQDDVDFYVDLALRSRGPVLEIGCGTGRIAIPTAAAGVDVVDIDLSPEMLEKAGQKATEAAPLTGSLELIQADMRTLDLREPGAGRPRAFPLVTIPARTLPLATTRADQLATLRSAARHLAPGGRLAFNAFVPDPDLIADTHETPFAMGDAVNPDNGRRCRLWAVNRFDPVTQTNHGQQIVEESDERGEVARRVTLDVDLRYLYPAEVHELLEESGLVAEYVYGDFDRSPLTEDSDEMVWIARRPTT